MSKYTSKDGKSGTGESESNKAILDRLVQILESIPVTTEERLAGAAMYREDRKNGHAIVEEFLSSKPPPELTDSEKAEAFNQSAWERRQLFSWDINDLNRAIEIEGIRARKGRFEARGLQGFGGDIRAERMAYYDSVRNAEDPGTEIVHRMNDAMDRYGEHKTEYDRLKRIYDIKHKGDD